MQMVKYACAIALLLCSIAITTPATARMITYPEGWSFMTLNDGGMNSMQMNYTVTHKLSLGYEAEYWRAEDYQLHALQMTHLLKRWNKRDSQANIYFTSGLGLTTKDNDADPAGYASLEADWEDRRYFISYKSRYTEAGDIEDFFMQSARVGITPYIGDYGDLHTWLMLDVQHTPERQDNFAVTPLVRLFKGTNLIEAGISNQGNVLFNMMITF